MNFSDDFEENLNLIIKWLMIISCIAIVLWCFIGIVKLVLPKRDVKPTPANTAMINEKFAKAQNAETENAEPIEDEEYNKKLMLDEDKIQVESSKGHTFKVNVKEMPDKLFFNTLRSNEIQVKKRELINRMVGENYIDSVLSYGTLERWNPESFPLKVYIAASPEVPSSHINEIKNAFTKWQDTTNDFITFKYVDNIQDADIICTYPKDFYRACSSDKSSETSKQYFTYDKSGHIEKSTIELTYKDCNGEVYAEDLVYAFALREIGHSLGLRGHSGKVQDKMLYYPQPDKNKSVRPEINTADINTLRLVYSVLPDKTNADFTEEQLKKLIRPEEVWGDKVERSASSETAILYNIERTPEVPSLHIALGNYYSENGRYDEAIEVYSRSIVLLNDADFKAKVYIRVGDAYSEQKRYLEAIEAYKLSLKSLNSEQNLFNVYFNLGFIYYQQEKYEDSLRAYQNAIQYVESKDSFFRLLMDLSTVYVKVGKYSEAQKCADKAYSLVKTKESQYMAAFTRYLNEDYVGAENFIRPLVDSHGGLMDYALLAQIYYKTQKFDALKELSVKANEKFPNNPPFTFE